MSMVPSIRGPHCQIEKSWGNDDISSQRRYIAAELHREGDGYSLWVKADNGQVRSIRSVEGLNGEGDLISRLQDTYVRIYPTSGGDKACVCQRLRGGMLEMAATAAATAAASVAEFVFGIAMQKGAAFITGEGSEQATMVEVTLMCDGKPVKGRYVGNMAKVDKEGCFFKKWAPYGQGKVIIENGDWYDGLWLNGRFCNTGVYETVDGRWRYEGQWRDGERVGYGKLFTQNDRGQRVLAYEGGWHKDQFHGQGTFTQRGREEFGLWENGKLVKQELPPEHAEAISMIPAVVDSVLGTFRANISHHEEEVIRKATGLQRNHLIAQALHREDVVLSVPLASSLEQAPPSIELYSFDARGSIPLLASPESRNIGLERLVLPKSMTASSGHLHALAWLQAYAAKFEKHSPETVSATFRQWTECPVPHQVIAMALPVDPQKGGRAEFAPCLKMLSEDTWGYIAWSNNGQQSASECVHVYPNTSMKIRTVKGESLQSWAMQAIDSERLGEAQWVRIRDAIDHNLSNALHFVLFRYHETPASSNLHSNHATGSAPATGTIVPGKHYEQDTRETYKANVYRTLDVRSLVCITLVGLPISVPQENMGPSQLQYCIKSHLDRMKELVQLSVLGAV
ncbi:MAG: hypothetical protein KGQ49_02410 [Verrucomicrobia bacterium]|nr:hypothetical protein [Verrucomicrobiota bacterium]MBU6446234.1 hypothetical protein [Verrucomicrobiota bacterium]MDE3047347.1 hypothetical protein [Verrucomicrobiota bacterium]